jgi:hypothetical protein
VFVPVVDKDDPIRVLSTNTHRMAANLPYHYAFFVAALPDGLNAADLSLAAVGTAKSVSVSR